MKKITMTENELTDIVQGAIEAHDDTQDGKSSTYWKDNIKWDEDKVKLEGEGGIDQPTITDKDDIKVEVNELKNKIEKLEKKQPIEVEIVKEPAKKFVHYDLDKDY